MLTTLDISHLCRQLQSRFDLVLRASVETIDGGSFPVIRPEDLELGVGFGIVIARTHRQVEASFRADNFAAGLLRRMRESDDEARAVFKRIRQVATETGASVYVGVNGDACDNLPDGSDEWRRLELDVCKRLPPGRSSPSELAERTLDVASTCLAMSICLLPIEVAGYESTATGLPEGAVLRVDVNRFERSPANRSVCLAHYGSRCHACGFDFKLAYGDIGEGYAEVHHRVPVSKMGPDYIVDPLKDLIPLCGNCHAMVHRRNPPLDIPELKRLIEQARPSHNSHTRENNTGEPLRVFGPD